MTGRGPVGVNPHPAGSPVLRLRRPGGRLPLRPCGTGGIFGPTHVSPAALRARLDRAENPPPA